MTGAARSVVCLAMAALATLALAASAHAGPRATRSGPVDPGAWGQLEGALAEVHGDTRWEPGSGDAADIAAELERTLDEAVALERAIDLAGALQRYEAGCERGEQALPSPAALERWQAACEGAVRMAFGVQDPQALDDALARLLHARPDHPLPAAEFPPPVIARAGQIAAELPRATLEIQGAAGPVLLDGMTIGQAPLTLADLPAGVHRVQCGGAARRIHLEPRGQATLRCPPADDPRSERALLQSLPPGEAHWVLAGEGGEAVRISPGAWVFDGEEQPVGLWVGAVPPASAITTWEQRARQAGGSGSD